MQFNPKSKTARIVLPLLAVLLILAALYHRQLNTDDSAGRIFEERFGPVMGTSGYVKIMPTSSLKSTAQDAFNAAYAA